MRCIYRRCGFPYKFNRDYEINDSVCRFVPICVDRDNWEIDSIQACFKSNLGLFNFFAGLYDLSSKKILEFMKTNKEITEGVNRIEKVGEERIFLKKGCKK